MSFSEQPLESPVDPPLPNVPQGEWIPGPSPAGVIVGSLRRTQPIVLAGEVDLGNCDAVARRLGRACAQVREGDVVLLDLTDLTFMDAAGARALHSVEVDLDRRGATLIALHPRPLVRLVLELGGRTVSRELP
ncbi:MAG: STAS domain-containing protein [Actinomycetota bacterium]|nr:STAS domain-containing protein [Actinomycetota bacterium]